MTRIPPTRRLQPHKPQGLQRFTRRHSPFQPPRFKWWHALIFLFFPVLMLGQQKAPGFFADVSSYAIGNWEAGIMARVTIIWLSLYAMLLVRTLHPLGYAAMIVSVFGVSLRLGEVRIAQEPLTFGTAMILLGLALYAIRIITRQPELGVRIKRVEP